MNSEILFILSLFLILINLEGICGSSNDILNTLENSLSNTGSESNSTKRLDQLQNQSTESSLFSLLSNLLKNPNLNSLQSNDRKLNININIWVPPNPASDVSNEKNNIKESLPTSIKTSKPFPFLPKQILNASNLNNFDIEVSRNEWSHNIENNLEKIENKLNQNHNIITKLLSFKNIKQDYIKERIKKPFYRPSLHKENVSQSWKKPVNHFKFNDSKELHHSRVKRAIDQRSNRNWIQNRNDFVVKSRRFKVVAPKIVIPGETVSNHFNYNNRISDIILERFGPNKAFSDGHRPRPNRFLSNRFHPTGRPYFSGADPLYMKDGVSTPSSFDDLTLGNSPTEEVIEIDIPKRLGKLDSIFKSLNVQSEECKRRIMCEVSKNEQEFSPLAEILRHETQLVGDLQRNARNLLDSDEGTRFLSYIDATTRGKDQFRQCDVYRYNCRQTVRDLIDMDSLMVWKEVVGWLTVKVLAKDQTATTEQNKHSRY